jgi:hypothetical protein
MPDGLTVSNSSCLIAPEAAGSLGILEQLYGTIAVPDAVAQEWGAARLCRIRCRSIETPR